MYLTLRRLSPVLRETCASCGELLIPPVFQCHRGHLYGSCCEAKLEHCPNVKCGIPITCRIENIYLDKTLEEINFRCRDCPEELPLLLHKHHQYDCVRRRHDFCSKLGLNCPGTFISADIVPHLQDVHHMTGIDIDDPSKIVEVCQGVLSTSLDSSNIQVQWMPHFIILRDKLFFLRTLSDTGAQCVSWVIIFAGSELRCEQIAARIRLMPAELHNNCQALEWQGPVYSISSQGFSPCFEVHVATLKQFGKNTTAAGRVEKVKWKIQVQLLYHRDPNSLDSDVKNEVPSSIVKIDSGEETTSLPQAESCLQDFWNCLMSHMLLFLEAFGAEH